MMCSSINYVYTAESKRSRVQNHVSAAADLISDMPEIIISHILSSLPTKDAVRTSVLSRNWKYKWTCITNVDVSDKGKRWGRRRVSFTKFVDRIIVLTNNSTITSFRLCYTPNNNSRQIIQSWITSLLSRNLQHIDIEAERIPLIVSSSCFSGWTLLVDVKLRLRCTLGVSILNCFPNLKTLGLYVGVIMKNEQQTCSSDILMDFPVLESLEMRTSKWLGVDSVVIQAPSLVRFAINRSFLMVSLEDYKIKLCAPKLNIFESIDGHTKNIAVSAPAVTHATVCEHNSNTTQPLQLLTEQLFTRQQIALPSFSILKGFPNLKSLHLSSAVVKALAESRWLSLLSSTLHRVQDFKLTSLLGVQGSHRNIIKLLHLMPFLESLNMTIFSKMSYVYNNDDVYVVGDSPSFMHLRKVEFKIFNREMDELDLVEYILKKSKNLEKLVVVASNQRPNIRRRLTKLITKGSGCVLQVARP